MAIFSPGIAFCFRIFYICMSIFFKMRKPNTWLVLAFVLIFFAARAQEHNTNNPNSELIFTVEHSHEVMPVKNQQRSSTCWSFSTMSFFESEIYRTKKIKVELAEMYVVRMVYLMKAQKYVRMHGTIAFPPGGAFHDPVNVLAQYGLVPREVYTGNQYGNDDIHH